MVCAVITCVTLRHFGTMVPCWWSHYHQHGTTKITHVITAHTAVHKPIMRSAVLCVSHSGDLVPDPQCSVPESRDIEILATHVSHYDLGMCV